jgi:hypothetical protein
MLLGIGDTGSTLRVRFGRSKAQFRDVQIAPDAESFWWEGKAEKEKETREERVKKEKRITSNQTRANTLVLFFEET